MSYYPNEIKLHESAIGFTSGIKEAMHITWIEDFFKQTNKRTDYKKQILDNHVEKFHWMIRTDVDMFSSPNILT